MFDKILIANRGEIAVRIIRACRDMGITSVAVYSTADADALHTTLADEAVCIGGPAPKDSYLNIQNIIGAAQGSGAQAIHPGFGFLSENPDFAAACEACGLTFIGPSAHTIALLGDKVAARDTAKKAGVPVTPGSDGAVSTAKEAAAIAGEIGYPVMLKAASGGGGKGIRKVDDPADLEHEFQNAAAEAGMSFGDSRVYVEKFVADPRHIEFQILADAHGDTIHLFERECSIQRRHQKLVEEAPSSLLSASLRQEMGDAAVRVAKQAGYRGAGTVEFLVDSDLNYYFCEMNARIQVEHPVTEFVTGLDLVREQLRIAAGLPLSVGQEEVRLSGCAMECRINAEDPREGFRPSPGRVEFLHLPGGPGVRVDTALFSGYQMPPYYDSLCAKVVVWAPTRLEAVRRMRRALEELMIQGMVTTAELCHLILYQPDFVKGQYHTGFLEENLETLMAWDCGTEG